jgi:hypothetical protein
MRIIPTAFLTLAAASMAAAPVLAQHQRPTGGGGGSKQAMAKPANMGARPAGGGAMGNRAMPTSMNNNPRAPRAGASPNINRPTGYNTGYNNGRNVTNQQAYRAGQASNNRYGKNTVVVAPPRGGYNNGYYGGGYYNDSGSDFGEFVGKAAVVTAGAAIVGSILKDKPTKAADGSDCQQTIQNGVPYVNCNGTWYQAVQTGTSTGYQQVQPPR